MGRYEPYWERWPDYTLPEPLTPERKAQADAEWDALPDVPRTIPDHLASLSPERRAELQKEWIDE